ncbi:MAG: SPOR domain-containing protein [Rhodospirillales bacterium]|jgi:cell division protein FtsN
MSDKPDRERMEPELGQDLLDILPDHGIGRAERDALSPHPLPRKKRRGFLLWFLLIFLASGAAFATWWWAVKEPGKLSGGATAEVPLVKADDRSFKSKPSSPGGMDVPDQDKMVYNRLNNPDEAAKQPVERLLPPPEAPQAPPAPVAPVAPPGLPDMPKGPVAETPKAVAPSIRDTTPPEPPPVEPPPMADDKLAKTAAKPPKIAADAKKPAAETVKVTASAGGAWLVQLGAIKEESAAARQWGQIQKANSDLLGGMSLDVQRADLGAKGIFYRLRAGSLDSKEAAKTLCQQLEARKQGCIVVHK